MFILTRNLRFKQNLRGILSRIKMQPTKRGITEVSNFDKLLQEEVKQAKKIQTEKLKRRKLEDTNELIKRKGVRTLRDEKGFKLRVIESNKNGKKKKQEDPEYEVSIEGDLRIVKPYYFTYKTFCKQRWRERKLFDIFVTEFRDRKESYYKKCIEEGFVYINDQVANMDTIVHDGNLITHKIHRHEPPVMATPIKVIREDDDILVIDKPSGVPVHPTGRNRFNSITKILERQLGYTVHPCNRLDKLTSGLMFLAKTPKGADVIGDQLKAREVSKEYIARVAGEFPCEKIIVENPLRTYDPRVALNKVCDISEDGAKHSKTVFQRISFDGQTSIVKCKPLTGRQHQIRVHLQYLGFPIANDPIYSNVSIWGPTLGKGGKANFNEVSERLHEIGKTKSVQSWFYRDIKGEMLLEDKCPECDTELCSKPDPAELILWLHAFKYATKPGLDSAADTDENNTKIWSYQTQYPEWALRGHRKFIKQLQTSADNCTLLVHNDEILSRSLTKSDSLEANPIDNMIKDLNKAGNETLPEGCTIYTTSVDPIILSKTLQNYQSKIGAIVVKTEKYQETLIPDCSEKLLGISNKIIQVPDLVH
ncbi:similar to Saccharomyces cerevisiae YDL036C PUS9 Mitochondrial tRNA:pseudouridine synthase, catalyzes the formation of pseudouridine at position 32 in mitochondrial tRNAs [Maudiozyma saulgeensis]|uniref:tRNA pseudouridine(32) synthase n=1 Tax=Maudiozyma saulgeensis TaxID=1789683 RepID=A0A1X7R3L0_9SACH|nr:similar to Saccharomyces cerevisiae YDL036C PUS9 Mitochondrial tRNA:pseudouridine synthase, catalyzes the formation of pseudouridine at position 32 in mitochondrial tRNAs [Kazachstania saulgeensis]